MHDDESLFEGANVVGFFEKKHSEADLSPTEKRRRRDERTRLNKALARRADWTPEMHEEERARIRAEIEAWEGTRDAA